MQIRRYQVISLTGIVIEDGTAIFYPGGAIFEAPDSNPSVIRALEDSLIIDITDIGALNIPALVTPTSPAGGDLTGFYPNPTIAQKGALISQVLTWTGSAWVPMSSGGGPPTGAAGGDLAGTYPNPTIAQKGATTNQVLSWNGSSWVPASLPSSLPPNGSASGDLAGTYPGPTIAQKGATTGQVLIWSGAAWLPGAPSPGGSAGGDLTGTYPNPTIAQNGATTGQVLTWNGSAWVPATPPGSSSGINLTYTNVNGSAITIGQVVAQTTTALRSVVLATATADNNLARVIGFVVPASLSNSASGSFLVEGRGTARFAASLTLTFGDEVFLSTTPGSVSNVAPSSTGNVIQSLGVITDTLTYNGIGDFLVEIQVIRGSKAVAA